MGIYRREALPRGVEPLSLSLWHVADPGNLGTILRSADAFGASVALSAGCADPTGPKAVRASAGAVFRVPLARFDEPEGTRIALVSDGRPAARRPRPRVPVTYVLGAEREGLPDDVVAALRRVGDDSARAGCGVAERRDRRRDRALRAPARPVESQRGEDRWSLDVTGAQERAHGRSRAPRRRSPGRVSRAAPTRIRRSGRFSSSRRSISTRSASSPARPGRT